MLIVEILHLLCSTQNDSGKFIISEIIDYLLS